MPKGIECLEDNAYSGHIIHTNLEVIMRVMGIAPDSDKYIWVAMEAN